jgi:hypothetical protein
VAKSLFACILYSRIACSPMDYSFGLFQECSNEMEEIQGQIKSVHKLTEELTHYLCEDESKIKLDDILNIFKTFCVNLNQAAEVSEMTLLAIYILYMHKLIPVHTIKFPLFDTVT